MNRTNTLNEVRSERSPFDVIIVGGGATGLGAAVDAAARGYRTLLVEQDDFAKGTTSRSTKLVHGGVRYLQQGNISMVLGALKERGLLYLNAPHVMYDQAFIIPSYKWWETPFYGIGMKVYDALAGKLNLAASRMLGRDEVIRQIPTVETRNLVGGVSYHDGQFDDSRLAVNLAQTAAGLGAAMLNYVKCVGLVKEGSRTAGVRARDAFTGDEFDVKGRAVINATGVDVDDLIAYDSGKPSNIVAVSQGIHLVLPKKFLPGTSALMVPKTADGRVLFAIPWHDHVVVGTTDTPIKKRSMEPRALAQERDFVMSHACKYLTEDPTDSDVLSVFAGLRPLVGKGGDSSNTAKLSRDHTIMVGQSGLITITGGKWTTYRKMANDVIGQAIKVGGLQAKPCRTEHLQVRGWTYQPDSQWHLSVYGADARGIRELMRTNPALAERIHPSLPYQMAEVVWHAREEMAQTVEDVLSRRTRSLLLNAAASIEAAPKVAGMLAAELGKDQAWIDAQVKTYTALARGYVYADPASTGTL
jgi:glycerol-3-phosphate dehydrogenase